MSFLKFSVPQRRHSLFSLKKPYSSCPCSKNLNSFSKLPSISPEFENNNNNRKKEETCNIKSKCSTKVFTEGPQIDYELPIAFFFSSNLHTLKEEINIPSQSKLPSYSEPTFNQIFATKVKICDYIFDFSKLYQFKGKKEKFNALNEINTLLSQKTEATLLSDQQKNLLYHMIQVNIFDQDPFPSSKKKMPLSYKLIFVEQSWEHLSLVYKILNKFVILFPEKCTFDLAKKSILLLNIPDTNEQESLVSFLKNYSKVHNNQFNDIWKQIKLALTNVRYDIYTAFCIDPIISYLSSILLTNPISIRDNYFKKILYTHLLPLFDNEKLPLYFNKLSNIITQLVDGDIKDQMNVIQYLIGHFPLQCGQKQPLFISALISISNSMNGEELYPIAKKLFAFIAAALDSPNFKLAEYALSLLMKPNMRPIIFSNYELAIETLYGPLKWSSVYYWEKSVKEQSSTVLSALMNVKLDFQRSQSLSDFVNDIEQPSNSMISFNQKETKKRDNKELAQIWGQLSRIASKRYNDIDLTKILLNIQIEFIRSDKPSEFSYKNSQSNEQSNDNLQLKNSRTYNAKSNRNLLLNYY